MFYLMDKWYANNEFKLCMNYIFLGVKGEPGIPIVGPKGSEGLPGEKGERGNFDEYYTW